MNTYGTHISEAELVQLARDGGPHSHCDNCAFCREQLEQLRSMLQASAPSPGANTMPKDFRLAAQSTPPVSEKIRWRQTWYLEDGVVVLRVVEDCRENQLIGYLLCAEDRLAAMRVRFSGIDTSFVPDAEGRFVIGPSSIAIEPMSVQLV
ncbi:MAG: hypothetical protein RRA94_04600 [Bacteroidota bacterium]|nr:hypothetical protein [Bacteroidota bacterium]